MGCGASSKSKALRVTPGPSAQKTLLLPPVSPKELRDSPVPARKQVPVWAEQLDESPSSPSNSSDDGIWPEQPVWAGQLFGPGTPTDDSVGVLAVAPLSEEPLASDSTRHCQAYAPQLQTSAHIYLTQLYCRLSSKSVDSEQLPDAKPVIEVARPGVSNSTPAGISWTIPSTTCEAYAPRLQGKSHTYLTQLEALLGHNTTVLETGQAVESTVAELHEAVPIVDSTTSQIKASEAVVEPYAPRLQANQHMYLTSLHEALRMKTEVSRSVPSVPVAAVTSESKASMDRSKVKDAKVYAPRLQERSHRHLASLADVLGVDVNKLLEAPVEAPHVAKMEKASAKEERPAADAVRTIAGDKVAVTQGLAKAAHAIADTKPRAAAGLAVMAAAVAETIPNNGSSKVLCAELRPLPAAGLAKAATEAAAAGSATAPGLIKAAAASATASAQKL